MANVICSECGAENSIPDGPAGEGYACFSCQAVLPSVPPVIAVPLALPVVAPMPRHNDQPLYIGQYDGNDEWSVQGPFPVAKIRQWIAAGKVRPDMYFAVDMESEDSWSEGHLWDGLFPETIEDEAPTELRGLSARRTPVRRSVRRPTPVAGEEEAAETSVGDTAKGLGCLVLIIIVLVAMCSGSDKDSVSGVYRNRFDSGGWGQENSETWLVLFKDGRFEWYEKEDIEKQWRLEMTGSWAAGERSTRKRDGQNVESTELTLKVEKHPEYRRGPGMRVEQRLRTWREDKILNFTHRPRAPWAAVTPAATAFGSEDNLLKDMGLDPGVLLKDDDGPERPSPIR